MRKCYFCNTTKGLKQIWLEDDIEGLMPWQKEKYRACCRQCFRDNELDEYEKHYENWHRTDYHWKPKKEYILLEGNK